MNATHHFRKQLLGHLRNEDLVCGFALILFAAFILFVARGYPVGTANNMGPGYFPRWLCYLLVGLGLFLVVSGLRRTEPSEVSEDELKLRPIFSIAASYIAFGVTLSTIGLLPAVALVVLISCYAIPKRRISEVIAIIVAMEALTIALWRLVQISVPLIGGS